MLMYTRTACYHVIRHVGNSSLAKCKHALKMSRFFATGDTDTESEGESSDEQQKPVPAIRLVLGADDRFKSCHDDSKLG